MATIAISCPKCEKQSQAPAELAGKKIRCKECQHVFVVKAPAAKTAAKSGKPAKADHRKPAKEIAAAKPPADDPDDDAKAYLVTEQTFLPRCAYCAKELESEDQIVCLNCGYNHRTRERPTVEKTYDPTAGEWTIHLLPGIACALLVLLAIGAIVLFWTMFPKWEVQHAEDWWSIFTLALPGRLWLSVICLFIGFLGGRFAIKRLAINYRPIERKMQTKKKD
jgi:DNA-directed RNA polymerase subunit RPC12/RpoP